MTKLDTLLKHDDSDKTLSVSLRKTEGNEAKVLLNIMPPLSRTTGNYTTRTF